MLFRSEPNPDWAATVFDTSSPGALASGFVAPLVGYFHNVIDYGGVIGPSGLPRAPYYQFRRDNAFYDAVEPFLAAAGQPRRSGDFSGAEPGLRIDPPALGVREDPQQRVHYWLEGADDVVFLSVLNQSGEVQSVPSGGIVFRGEAFPR